MADTLAPAGAHARRALLSPGLAAAGEARGHVREAGRAWAGLPVDWEVAVMTAGALVASAARRFPGQGAMLGVSFADGQLRVEVDYPDSGAPASGEADPGLAVVALVSPDWGSYPSPAGTTSYFTLGQPGALSRA